MRIKLLLSILIVGALWSACSTPSDNILKITSSMRGTVQLLNQDSDYYYVNRSGVKVALQGSTYSTVSDDSGAWNIDDIPPGIYTIVLSKTGFDTANYTNHKFSGAGVDFVDPLYIHATSHVVLTLDSLWLGEDTGRGGLSGRSFFARGALRGTVERPNIAVYWDSINDPNREHWISMYPYGTLWQDTTYTFRTTAGYFGMREDTSHIYHTNYIRAEVRTSSGLHQSAVKLFTLP